MNDIAVYVEDLAREAKAASRSLGFASDEARCAAVRAMATALRQRADEVLEANAIDMDAARAAGTSDGLLDRLLLTPERVEGMAAGLDKLADLPDPMGRVLDERDISEGVHLRRVSVPLGLVAMVYEARPNVTADAAGICIRTGNAAHGADVVLGQLGGVDLDLEAANNANELVSLVSHDGSFHRRMNVSRVYPSSKCHTQAE